MMHEHKLTDGTTIRFGVIHVNADGFMRVGVVTVEATEDGTMREVDTRLVDLHDQEAVDAIHEIVMKVIATPPGATTMRGDLLAQIQAENATLKGTVERQAAALEQKTRDTDALHAALEEAQQRITQQQSEIAACDIGQEEARQKAGQLSQRIAAVEAENLNLLTTLGEQESRLRILESARISTEQQPSTESA